MMTARCAPVDLAGVVAPFGLPRNDVRELPGGEYGIDLIQVAGRAEEEHPDLNVGFRSGFERRKDRRDPVVPPEDGGEDGDAGQDRGSYGRD